MSDTLENLRRKIEGAGDLESVVRTMKALAASNIGQYEQAVRSLGDYYRTVELGLAASVRRSSQTFFTQAGEQSDQAEVGAVVFGSDQGLVGQFNDLLADFVAATLSKMPGEKEIWAVGERVHDRLADAGLAPARVFAVPNSVSAITPLVGEILIECESHQNERHSRQLYLFHNRPTINAAYEPVSQRLLPLDAQWRQHLLKLLWPSVNLPEVLSGGPTTLRALTGEYLFVSLFRACAESLASENSSRLSAMQRAEKNIGELLENLRQTFHRLRQTSIDEELFDVISGFEALSLQNKLIEHRSTSAALAKTCPKSSTGSGKKNELSPR
jgi:F-type H+-transporting ATPase subunit gamma